jgi:hypothetical protein
VPHYLLHGFNKLRSAAAAVAPIILIIIMQYVKEEFINNTKNYECSKLSSREKSLKHRLTEWGKKSR